MIFNWLPQMPFTDNHQLDLDWLISKYKKLEDDEATIQASLEGAEAAKEDAEAAATDAANSATAAAASANEAGASASDAAETAESISDSLNQIAVNTSRINNLVANAGDTDGNAELLDIRIGYNGETYATAGDAVREQVEDLHDITNLTYIPLTLTTHSGYFNSVGDVRPADPSNVEVYSDPLDVSPGMVINWDYDSGRDPMTWTSWIGIMYYTDEGVRHGERQTILNSVVVRTSGTFTIPEGVYKIALTYRTFNTASLTIHAYAGMSIYREMSSNIQESRTLAADTTFPLKYGNKYGHLFIHNVSLPSTTPIIIPCQSVFDVEVTARLGFKYIEGNVHATATPGKYVVTHGISGALGNDFEKLDGTSAAGTVIANTSYDDLRANYRYRSEYAKYKVPITSLEEFCTACKQWNIKPLLQYVDNTELEIAQNIIDKYNIILYAGNRSSYDGYIMEYNELASAEAIEQRCIEVGAPYMYCMANPSDFTDDELETIRNTVHKYGCYIGNAGNYDGLLVNRRLEKLAFDFSAAGSEVNRFDDGNILQVSAGPTFNDITTTGNVANGSLYMAENQKITISSNDDSFIKKFLCDIRFNGTLIVKYPEYIDQDTYKYITINSDGNEIWTLSEILIDQPLSCIMWAGVGGAEVLDINYKLSKC